MTRLSQIVAPSDIVTANGTQTIYNKTLINPIIGGNVLVNGVDVRSVQDTQNTSIAVIQGTDVSQNARMTIADGVDVTQNTRLTVIEGTDTSQNVRINYSNTAITIIQGVDLGQNTAIAATDGKMQSAYNQANTGTVLAQASYAQANVTVGVDASQNVRIDYSNTAITIIQGVDSGQNTRMTIIEGVDATQNTNISNKVNLTGSLNQTISGNVTISQDLIISGNLIITGNISSQNVQQLAVADPLIVLGIGNYVSDTKDIGFAAHYNDGVNAHAGIIRDSGTKEFYVFRGYTPEVDAVNNVDINDASFSKANLNAGFFKGNLIATTAVVNGIDLSAYSTAAFAQANVTIGVDATQNTRLTVIEGTNASQNVRLDYSNTALTIAQGVDNSQNVRIDYSNTAITIIQGVDSSQNARMTIIEGVDVSQNARMVIIEGTDVSQNARMAISDGVNASQNTRIDYSNTALTIAQGVDNSQNVRIDYSNTAITILQGVNAGQNSNIAFVQTLANTDFTNVSIATTTSSSNGLYIPVITVAANGRVTAISNTLITGGGSSAGYLANSVIFANTTGYLSNTSNISFYTSNNTLIINGTLAATSKSFSIPHPTKPNTQLRYGSLEGPENGVYVRGRIFGSNTIELPEYWTKLVDENSITVQLTPIDKHQNLFVKSINENTIVIGNENIFNKDINCFYVVFAERKDVGKLQVEVS